MDRDIVRKLKEQWDDIYLLDIRGQEYIIRSLTFREFDVISKVYNSEWDSADAEEAMVLKAVVYPENFDMDRTRAGTITSLAQEVLTVSGFLPDDQYTKDVLKLKRTEMREFRNMMKAFIIAAMPSYKDTDLDGHTFAQLSYKLALAEKIIEIQQEVFGMEPSDLKLQFVDGSGEIEEVVDPEELLEGKPPSMDPIAQKLHQALGG